MQSMKSFPSIELKVSVFEVNLLKIRAQLNITRSHLYSPEDCEGPAAEDGVLEDGGNVLVSGLHEAHGLRDGEGEGARAVVVLQVVAHRQVLVHGDTQLRQVVCRAHA